MKHFYKSLGENWFTYPNLYTEMVNRFESGTFVEVGVWKGMSAAYMAVEIINSGKPIQLHCVDSWEYLESQSEIPEHKFSNLYQTFLNNIDPVKNVITPIKSISWEAASLYQNESLEFVFIDAAHDYESVTKDITAWFPKVKKGGVIAGHDYSWGPQVKKAVDDYMQKPVRELEGCWIFEK